MKKFFTAHHFEEPSLSSSPQHQPFPSSTTLTNSSSSKGGGEGIDSVLTDNGVQMSKGGSSQVPTFSFSTYVSFTDSSRCIFITLKIIFSTHPFPLPIALV